MRLSIKDPLAIQAWRLKSIGASKGSQVCTLTWPGNSASVSVYKPKEKQALSFRYELDLPEQGKQHISFSIDIRWVYGNGFESLLLSCPNTDCNKMVDTLYQALGGYFVCVVCWNLQEAHPPTEKPTQPPKQTPPPKQTQSPEQASPKEQQAPKEKPKPPTPPRQAPSPQEQQTPGERPPPAPQPEPAQEAPRLQAELISAALVLGVPPTASLEAAQKVFRALVQCWHPDRNQHNLREANAKTSALNAAFDVFKRHASQRVGG